MKNLYELNFAKNQLKNFPNKINLKSSIKLLYLSDNLIGNIPDVIGGLKSQYI